MWFGLNHKKYIKLATNSRKNVTNAVIPIVLWICGEIFFGASTYSWSKVEFNLFVFIEIGEIGIDLYVVVALNGIFSLVVESIYEY